jgi:hypothetical protein
MPKRITSRTRMEQNVAWHAQLAHARPDVPVQATLAETIASCRTALSRAAGKSQ